MSVKMLLLAALLGVGVGGCIHGPPLKSEPQTSDQGIANLASLRMSSDARLCPYDITVIVFDRTARLEGKVADEADRQHAQQVALGAGALQVEDRLTMDPSARNQFTC